MTVENDEKDERPSTPTGGYYWVPTPVAGLIQWSVLTCHDLGFGPEAGHHEIWPSLIGHLARTWGREPGPLRDRLRYSCYGLPRGRIVRRDQELLLIHGDDAPVTDWLPRVVERFHLEAQAVGLVHDEDKETATEHRRAVNAEFGLSIGHPESDGGEDRC